MDKNERQRRAYADMDQRKKEAVLKRRRDAYASRRGCADRTTSPSVRIYESSSIGNTVMPPRVRAHVDTSLSICSDSVSIPSNLITSGNEVNIGPKDSTSSAPIHSQALLLAPANQRRKRNFNEHIGRLTRASIDRTLYSFWSNDISESTSDDLLSHDELHVRQKFSQRFVLPPVPVCRFCNAKRFHLEPPGFCCCEGDISLVSNEIPPELAILYTEDDDDCIEFRKYIRSYNNNLAFTTFSARTDPHLLRNTKGVYTFKIQGKVHHFLGSLLPQDDSSHGLHLYFYDTETEVSRRLEYSIRFRESIMTRLVHVLSANPYTMFLKQLKDLNSLDEFKILLTTSPRQDQRTHNLPSCNEVAAIISATDDTSYDHEYHIQIYTKSATPYKISHTYGCYDPLQYPLLFPRGETGWHYGMEKIVSPHKTNRNRRCKTLLPTVPSGASSAPALLNQEGTAMEEGKKKWNTISCREYYCYKIQIRDDDKSMLLRSGRLFQQFVVDMFAKIESTRLDFHKKNQREIRTEFLQGIVDSIISGHTTGEKVGKKFILPASFMGGPRDMRKRYLDAMSLVQRFGKPDFFLTMTCNPSWPEITNELAPGELPQNRPDLVSRVFRAKLETLKDELIKDNILGEIAAYAYSIEFQKRGLPHAHLLLIMKKESKPLNPEAYDRFISAELPCPKRFPLLYSQVVKNMLHGPCGSLNPNNPCMTKGKCKNKYPKPFLNQTTHGNDSYPHYRRRNYGISAEARGHILDNRWVVPYNPYLLNRYDCHINLEICSTIKLVKYIYKYIYKGPDKVAFHIANTGADNEIKEYENGRWIAPPEATWRIFAFPLFEIYPSVLPLQVHLPNNNPISFQPTTNLQSLVSNISFSKTMLTEFFTMNKYDARAKSLNCLYKDFPTFFVWDAKEKRWTERKQKHVIGRVVTVNPSEGDRYYLRLLLNHIPGPTSYDDLLTVNAYRCKTFREAASKHGLLTSDYDIEKSLEEASLYKMPSQFRHLFATILVYCEPKNPKRLWEKFEPSLSEDYLRSQELTLLNKIDIRRKVLRDLSGIVDSMGKKLSSYHLCPLTDIDDSEKLDTREFAFEKNIVVTEDDLLSVKKLNQSQHVAYDSILKKALSNEPGCFFVDGPGGTGKTFLYKAILATLRSQGYIALATATSGVAAALLPGGRTAHSRFKLPLHNEDSKIGKLSKQSSVAKLIRESKVIIWDEAPMANKHAIESFEELLRDLTENSTIFGGKVVVFGGDFRQVLPVVKKGSRQEQIESSLISSHLWSKLSKFQLSQNMRAINDPFFTEFLLRIGNGTEHMDAEGEITLPENMLIPFIDKEKSLKLLINSVYPDIYAFFNNSSDVVNRALLAPTNECVDDINEIMIDMLPGEPVTYLSTDVAIDPQHQGDYEDFINSLNPSSLPPHELKLKPNCPIILLRNLNPTEGFCNGTRLICKELNLLTIKAEVSNGPYIGRIIILNKIPLQSSDDDRSGIPFKRYQFPIRLCFAMTINKSQGQTLDYVGIYLHEPVFSHGQLYVALSRAKRSSCVKVLIISGTFSDHTFKKSTRNVVFEETFVGNTT